MKVAHNIFDNLITLENIFHAWKEFKSGKANRKDVIEFECNLENNLFGLYEELVNRTYKHSTYTAFWVYDPKPRFIHKAGVRDRIVHYLAHQALTKIFEPIFIFDSYSSRLGKGTHKAVNRLKHFARKVSKNFKKPCFALKCDIKKFFDSIDRKILFKLIARRVRDKDFLWFVKEIIGSYEVGYERERERERVTSLRDREVCPLAI